MPTEPQIVNVLGEQVALSPVKIPPAEKFLVSFESKYKYEDMTAAEEQTVKKIFIQLFSASSPFLPGQKQPEPPCSSPEKQILLKSLQHRFDSLRDELIGERKTQSDSLRLRQIVEHAQRLKKYIDFLQSTDKCQELDEDILGEALGDLTDEEILQLLRQFVFFVLQGRHPLKEFLGKDPNPKGFVTRLSRNPITNFESFLQQYKDQKHSIPIPIEKVLQVTQLGLEELREEVKNTLEEKTNVILQMIGDIIPEDDTFWNGLDTTNLELMIQRLLEKVVNLSLELEDCNQKRTEVEGNLMDIFHAKNELEGEVEALKARIALLEKEKENLHSNNGNDNGASNNGASNEGASNNESSNEGSSNENNESASSTASSESLTSADAAYGEIIADLNTQVDELQASIRALKTREAELLGQLELAQASAAEKQAQIDAFKGQEAELKTLQAANKNLTEQLEAATAKIRACEGLQARVSVLESQLQGSEARLAELRGNMGELTAQIDGHLQEKAKLLAERKPIEEELGVLRGFAENLQGFLAALEGDKQTVVNLLSNLQAARAEIKGADDPILQQIIALRDDLVTSDSVPVNMASMVGQILRQVQYEVNDLDAQMKKLTAAIEVQDAEIERDKQAMEESNEVLRMVRAGRTDLDGKGFHYDTDKDFLQDAARAVEAEREVQAAKTELEAARAELAAENAALLKEIEALKTNYKSQLDALRDQLAESNASLEEERATVATLQGTLATSESEKTALSSQIGTLLEDLRKVTQNLDKEKADSAQRLQDLEQLKIRECEEKLATLRKEEQVKRDALLGAQGAEKGSLEARIAELLKQISTTESQRDGFQAAVELEKKKTQAKTEELEGLRVSTQETIEGLKAQLESLQQQESAATGKSASLQSQLDYAMETVTGFKGQITDNIMEKAKLYELISTIAKWITSGAKLPRPTIDEELNTKYGLNRILEAFLGSLPPPSTPESPRERDSFSTAMSRCYLVFFMTYVYARHFPSKADGDSNTQSQITAFLRGILTDVYRQMDAGIPGKLDPVGAGGIPVQLKSKYLMNLFLPLVKQMEIIHESNKKGADFLKFPLLDQDQVTLLHKVYTVVKDKIKATKDIVKTINLYVLRRTGNVDDDIANLYLRFVTESASKREFPVVLYVPPDVREIPKFTFPSPDQLEQFLSTPTEKTATVKVAPPMDKALVNAPVFSFNLLFYLFLFVVKDYLSSVEGELSKAGCPLPPILKLR